VAKAVSAAVSAHAALVTVLLQRLSLLQLLHRQLLMMSFAVSDADSAAAVAVATVAAGVADITAVAVVNMRLPC